jgi:Holliday junction resolvase RusA-like endonuclease
MRVSFEVPGAPRGKGRPRFARRGNFVSTHTDAKTASYENLIKLAASAAMRNRLPISSPCCNEIVSYVPIPKSFSKKKHSFAAASTLRPTTKPDLDNVVKIVCDALNNVVYDDDKLIISMIAEKYYDERPRLEVTVETIEER